MVTDEELEQLYRETNFSMPHEAQMYNTLVMAFHMGSRPEMMMCMDVESLVVETRNDTKVMKCSLGTMKNMQGTLVNVNIARTGPSPTPHNSTRPHPPLARIGWRLESNRQPPPANKYTTGLVFGDVRTCPCPTTQNLTIPPHPLIEGL